MKEYPITVTRPFLPPLKEFFTCLEDIWNRKWITNNGYYHQELEKALCEYLKVPYISLFTNGTIPLMVALQTFN
jgi:dTDP-4-amino-4,6-dideoxygalactose transaminase